MFDTCREEAPSRVMVASLAEFTKFMKILTMDIGWWFEGADNFFSVYIKCLLRVC
jgi:hypothetical protein